MADNPATATTERTFTEVEVQERIRAATSTTQSDLRAAAMERDLYKRQVTTAEGAQTDAERLLGQAKATIDALQKAEGMTDDIVSWSNWKGQKEAEIASARTDLDRGKWRSGISLLGMGCPRWLWPTRVPRKRWCGSRWTMSMRTHPLQPTP